VCHHEVCQEINNGLPLALCLKCDEVQHLGTNSKHARFEINKPRMKLTRANSTHSNPSDHDSGAEEDITDGPIKVEKKTRGYSTGKRKFKLTANSKRKPRRHNTDDPGREFFTVKFHGDDGDVGMEIVPALKGKTLKESLEPLFSERDMSFLSHSVFLDASNTPLPLAFDTFPMGGNILHVRANGVVKVDQRVIDMVQSVEDCKPPDNYQKPRSKSVMHVHVDNNSFSRAKGNIKKLEQDERERQADEQLKLSLRGKKNIMNFFGEDHSNPGFTTSNPAIQSGTQSGTGTLHRPKSTSKLTGLFINQPKPAKEVAVRGSTIKDLLDLYNVYGLRDLNQVDTSLKDEPHEEDMKLEESWMDVVDQQYIDHMTKKEKDQQEAIWELLSTEVAYIEKLSVVKKLFILCLKNVQNEGFLQDIEIPKLFSNIENIYELNLSFWLDCLSDVVKHSRKTGTPLDPLHMSDSFPMFDKRFEPYITYCTEESHCLKNFKRNMAEDEDFKTYIMWCEEHRLCTNRLKLSDYLVKPMQRLTKYPLLLKAIQKKTMSEKMKDDIGGMISTVESLLSKVNGAMRILYENNKLLSISKRITNNYNVIEAVNDEMERLLTNYSSFDLMELMPGLDQHRCVINEGPLRLVEKQGKMDVHVFLFTDLLLLTKAKKGDKYRVLKPPLMVDKLHVHQSKDQGTFLLIYVNEYNTAVQAFALQGTTPECWTMDGSDPKSTASSQIISSSTIITIYIITIITTTTNTNIIIIITIITHYFHHHQEKMRDIFPHFLLSSPTNTTIIIIIIITIFIIIITTTIIIIIITTTTIIIIIIITTTTIIIIIIITTTITIIIIIITTTTVIVIIIITTTTIIIIIIIIITMTTIIIIIIITTTTIMITYHHHHYHFQETFDGSPTWSRWDLQRGKNGERLE
ncbi:hypothetical protein QZH41_018307, partial [Actinostola sp. cb2023]